MTLYLARNLDLPDDAVTQTFAILARRGAGKTYTAKVLAEEMIEAGYPVVILDPVGVWHGLRSNAAGTGAGYPVTILGGEHGDLPLDAHAGVLVANLVASEPVAVVLDLSGFDSKNQQRQFVTDFAERLYRAKAQQSERTPLHLIIDEADEFAPQKSFGTGDARMLGAFETLVRRGRARGIGVTMITQRPAVLNKNVLTQTECLVVMQITAPQDRKAIGEWVKGNASEDDQKLVDDSLSSLQQGEAWFWSPAWLQTLVRVKIRKARTFDSSATPKPGEVRREAKVLAPVDLDRLKQGMDRVVKDAERNDPKLLQSRVRELERELAKRPTEEVVREVEVPVEVSVVPEGTAAELRALLADYDQTIAAAVEVADRFERRAAELATALGGASAVRAPRTSPTIRPSSPNPRPSSASSTPSAARTPAGDSDVTLGKCERAILTVLAQHPDGRTNTQLTTMAGYRYSGGFKNSLSALRTAGYMTGGNTETMRATDAGLDALGEWEPLPTGRALLDYWLTNQLGGSERVILEYLVETYPNETAGPALAAATGYQFSGGFKNALSKLRTLDLVVGRNMEGVRVADDFMEAIA